MSTIMRKMNMISRCEALYRAQQLEEDLAGIYHSYILVICRKPGMSQDWLAKYLCVNKSSVTRHLANLEKRGYIERKVCAEDKRELLVYPTQKMLDIREEVVRITREWNALVSEGLTEEELMLFHSILQKMADKSQEIIYGGAPEYENSTAIS